MMASYFARTAPTTFRSRLIQTRPSGKPSADLSSLPATDADPPLPRAMALTIRPETPRRTSVNREIVPIPPVYGDRRDDRFEAVKLRVQSVHGLADVYSPGSQTPRR